MKLIEKLDWVHPLIIAKEFASDFGEFVLLYSGMQTRYTGRYSFLALNKQEEITGGFGELEKKLTPYHPEHRKWSAAALNKIDPLPLAQDDKELTNAWFGYLGYGLKNELENLIHDSESFINTPDLWFARFRIILVFDHREKNIEIWAEEEGEHLDKIIVHIKTPSHIKNTPLPATPYLLSLNSNMSRATYIKNVRHIKEAIKNGDLYQANLTRKFFGEISDNANAFDIFIKLCEISPAPYSAFIKSGDLNIISSSPERFLNIDKNGNANTRPIKGSAARQANEKQDKEAISNLQKSEKDKAENLMIVDLSRNDLARNCNAGSIRVEELFNIETYATVHHMVSSISGIKKNTSSTIELIKGCFPPGSMTGTPKIQAMQTCSKLENLKRGIYGGAIGWFGGEGSADLSVVIRTIILQGNKFEFQVGGAIVNDSDEESEFTETMLKAKGVAGALGIPITDLEKL